MEAKNKIIVALDVDHLDDMKHCVKILTPYVWGFKVGLELATAVGTPLAVNFIHSRGGNVFFDGKFHDIPNTVGKASSVISELGVKMFNVHASAGIKTMKAAVTNKKHSLALAVTILTSLGDDDEEDNTSRIYGEISKAKVLQFARDAKACGMDGIICSPQELELIGNLKEFSGFLKVTPGIRPKWAAINDQKRIMTPAEAIGLGADYLVIGRPITNPPKEIGTPVNAIKKILEEIEVLSHYADFLKSAASVEGVGKKPEILCASRNMDAANYAFTDGPVHPSQELIK